MSVPYRASASAYERRGNGAGALLAESEDDELAKEQFDLGEDVLLCGEGHFEVDLVELAGAAVGAGGLVPEAGGYLEIPLDPADHEQLFELLGRLGEGVELAGVEPARHQVVAGALGRRDGQHGRLHLQEPALGQVGPHDLAEAGSFGQPLDERPPPHVQVAVRKAGFLADLAVALDREREHVGRRQDLDARHLDLDRTGRQLGVDRRRRPGHHLAGHADGALQAEVREGLEGGVGGVGDDLDDPGAVVAPEVPLRVAGRLCNARKIGLGPCRVPQVHEEQATVVAFGGHPTGEPDLRADVPGAELAAAGGPVAVGGEGLGGGYIGHVGNEVTRPSRAQ